MTNDKQPPTLMIRNGKKELKSCAICQHSDLSIRSISCGLGLLNIMPISIGRYRHKADHCDSYLWNSDAKMNDEEIVRILMEKT